MAAQVKSESQSTPQQQFCVRWNSYQVNLQNTFPKLLSSEHFVDVTLACEAEMIKCHKVVLSACSTYFEKLLVQNPCQHPIIFMKDMKYAEMQALVHFMYRGEVNVTQDELPSLLRSAEALQIRGLCGSDQLLSQHYLGNMQQAGKQTPTQDGQTMQTPIAQSTPIVNGEKKDLQNGDINKQIDTTNGDNSRPVSATGGGVSGGGGTETPTNLKRDLKREQQTTPQLSINEQRYESGNDDSSSDNNMKSNFEPQMSLKEEMYDNDDNYYDNGDELMDAEYLEQDDDELNQPSTSAGTPVFHTDKTPDYAMANVSCQYNDGSPGGGIPSARRIRRSEAELRRAAECITRGQTFQTVSDQFNIPISTIRFYMARKGILPRRKRGRACSAPGGQMMSPQSSGGGGSVLGVGHGTPLSGNGGFHNAPGNTSPSGPPYHIVHYKLPVLGAKLK